MKLIAAENAGKQHIYKSKTIECFWKFLAVKSTEFVENEVERANTSTWLFIDIFLFFDWELHPINTT